MKKTYDIFISHIHVEEEYAIKLKKVLNDNFPTCNIYVSSDNDSTGSSSAPLTTKIIKALTESQFTIVLCSNISISSPWVAFELGVSVALKHDIALISYIDLTPKIVPPPFNNYITKTTQLSSIKWLFNQISKKFNLESIASKDIQNSCSKLKIIENKLAHQDKLTRDIKASNAVGGFAFKVFSENILKIILVKTRDGKRYIFPKGKIVKGQSAKYVLMEHELVEEAGINGNIVHEIKPIILSYRKGNEKAQNMVIYIVNTISQGEPREPFRDPEWYTIDEALKKLEIGREADVYEVLRGAIDEFSISIPILIKNYNN